jgi:hypothetical protein
MRRVRRRLPVLLGLLALVAAGRAVPAPAQTPTPTASPTATPPPPPAPLLPPATELLVPELASDAFTSPRLQLRWRGRGDDDARAIGFHVDVRPLGLTSTADWRTLVAGSLARSTAFTGEPGVAYVVRASTHGPDGYGPPAAATVLVPLDERNEQVRRSRGWRRQRRPGAWNGATAVATSSKAIARLRFKQRRVRVIARRYPSAGRLAVTLDGRRSVVSLAGPLGERQVAFDSGPLRAGRHRLTLRPAGGRVEIDAIAPG